MGPRQPPPLRPQRPTAINIKTGIWMFFQHWTMLIFLGLETPTTKAKNLKTLFSKQNWNEKCKNGLKGTLLRSVHCSIVCLRINAESPDWKNVCSVLNKAFFEEGVGWRRYNRERRVHPVWPDARHAGGVLCRVYPQQPDHHHRAWHSPCCWALTPGANAWQMHLPSLITGSFLSPYQCCTFSNLTLSSRYSSLVVTPLFCSPS